VRKELCLVLGGTPTKVAVMRAQPGHRVKLLRRGRGSGLLASALASCCLCLPLFAEAAQGAQTYTACGPGGGSDASCIVGTNYGAVFDGHPGNRYKLCVTPGGRDRDCKRFKADGELHSFGDGGSYDLSEGAGYSFIDLTGISPEPTCSPPVEVGEPCGHLTLRWYKAGHKIDRDRLTVLVGD
jgi:hypothetical protein